jgi:hypothetical protein
MRKQPLRGEGLPPLPLTLLLPKHMQATRLSERAKAAWATKSSEEAMALELSAEAAQKEAILMSKAAESSWKEAMGIEAEATRLSLAVQVLLCLCLCI